MYHSGYEDGYDHGYCCVRFLSRAFVSDYDASHYAYRRAKRRLRRAAVLIIWQPGARLTSRTGA